MIASLPFTLPALQAAYAGGTAPEAVIDEVYRRIAAVDDPAIFLHLRKIEEVRAEARALGTPDPARPLWGIPFVVKDNIDVAGLPTTAACPAYAYTPERDAFVVARLRAAGAIPIGKTNLDQFATGLVGTRSPHGAPKNAVDPALVPGGSSSGSAVAVGHGLVSFSLGTDTAGSGRVPAALNNIVGLKPSLGSLSASGVVPACRTLDTVSIFALTVEDAYAAFAAAAGYDPDDAYSRDLAPAPLAAPPMPVRVGIPSPDSIEFFGDALQAEMFDAALGVLCDAGAEIVPLDFTPFHETARMLYEGAWVAERLTVVEDLMRDTPDALHPVTRQIIGAARDLGAADAFRGLYRLRALSRAAQSAMAGIDMLCVPTIPAFCTVAELDADPIGPNARLGTYTNFVNLLDLCGIAVPTGPRSDGLPGSVTLLGRAGQDATCAALAQVFERNASRLLGATGHPVPAPATPPPAAGPDEIAIAVCGAHMSGLPLNPELTVRGARFLERGRTEPAYRLYALAGGPPLRPGLLRIEKGAAIELELWAMPLARFGDFMRTIPMPLSIGSVRLDDGRAVHGFLVEASGVQGAQDITHFAGWRKFLAADLSPTCS